MRAKCTKYTNSFYKQKLRLIIIKILGLWIKSIEHKKKILHLTSIMIILQRTCSHNFIQILKLRHNRKFKIWFSRTR